MKRLLNSPFGVFTAVLCIALVAMVALVFAAATPASVQAAPNLTGPHCGENQHVETIQVEKCEWRFNWHTWQWYQDCHFEDKKVCVDNPPPPDPVCEDESANNYGDPLPCTYDEPDPVCEDESANNYGQEGECTYDDPPVVDTPDYHGGKSCYMLGWGPKGCSQKGAGDDLWAIYRSRGVLNHVLYPGR